MPYSPDNRPLVLTVPGLANSGPSHWQSLWEARRADCLRVELGDWDQPSRRRWVARLDETIRSADGPVFLAAHSLGCHVVAWWAQQNPDAAEKVAGALLVAPAEVDFFPLDDRLEDFSPTPVATLPFPATLVASRNDPYMGIHTAGQIARRWGAELVDVGHAGHINAESDLGDWPEGQALLDALIAKSTRLPTHSRSPSLDVGSARAEKLSHSSHRSIHS